MKEYLMLAGIHFQGTNNYSNEMYKVDKN